MEKLAPETDTFYSSGFVLFIALVLGGLSARCYVLWQQSRAWSEPPQPSYLWPAAGCALLAAWLAFMGLKPLVLRSLASPLQVAASAHRFPLGGEVEALIHLGPTVAQEGASLHLVQFLTYDFNSAVSRRHGRLRKLDLVLEPVGDSPGELHVRGRVPPDAPPTRASDGVRIHWYLEVQGRVLGLPFALLHPVDVVAPAAALAPAP